MYVFVLAIHHYEMFASVGKWCTCSHFRLVAPIQRWGGVYIYRGENRSGSDLGPPSLIVSSATFACANWPDNICWPGSGPNRTTPSSQLAIPSCQLPVTNSQLPSAASVFAVILDPSLHTVFYPPPSRWVYTYFLCAQRKLIWLVARWLLPVQWRAGKVGLKNPLTGSDISGASSVRQPFFYEWKIALSLCLALPR